MTDEEIDFVKKTVKRLNDSLKEVWTERNLVRNLIIERGWMTEPHLDAAIALLKAHPAIMRQVENHWASAEQQLAEIGLDSWLEDFDKRYPSND
jgi:hypothetical protein